MRRLCPDCKESYEPPEELRRQFVNGSEETTAFYRARGCESCDYTGYFGRVGLYEVMPLSPNLRELILEQRGESAVALRDMARREGMKTLAEQGIQKVLAGVTSIEEVSSVPAEEGE